MPKLEKEDKSHSPATNLVLDRILGKMAKNAWQT